MSRHHAHTARRALDRRLADWRSVADTPPPARGWVRALRDALGMTGSQLAARLGTSASAVSQLERSEQDASIRLDTLRRAAAALDCRLVYALVPNDSLESIVTQRARMVAARQAAATRQSMLLEDQLAGDDADAALIAELAARIIDTTALWGEDDGAGLA